MDNCNNVCVRQSTACVPQGGDIINNNTNTNTQTQTVNVTQPGGGNVGIGGSGQILGVTTLPKTGLPELAWSALALIPTGFTLRRFRKIKKVLENAPQFIWEDRKFKTSSY